MVASILIKDLESIPFDEISNCIQDAITLDKEMYFNKTRH